tara:strand:- start:231 stop:521 length:291 start_codon:yes stop_codon:yes gene_type:complete
MKTLDYRTSKTLESTRLQLENGCNNSEEVILFLVSETYNVYTDGTKDVFKKYYIKNDERTYAPGAEYSRHYASEKGYRNAIKRWSKEAVTVYVKKD